jgi:hypothetical protein
MAVSIRFDKAKAERILDALATGKPIEGVRSVDEVLALAGACFFTALSRSEALETRPEPGEEGEEPAEGTEACFVADLHAAIEYYGQLTMLVAAGDYDQSFEPRHRAIVAVEEGEKTVIPLEGMRGDALEVGNR